MAKTTRSVKSKTRAPVREIRLSVHSSFNNTIVTASDFISGKVIAWSSSGKVGFKGTKKGTPYAATTAMKALLEQIGDLQPEVAHVYVSGAGNGRDAALRAIIGSGLKIAHIEDITALPHNGSRPKKARRV